jgi:hypothetical protein
MKKLEDVLKEKNHGLCYGNRILLPFNAMVLKVAVAGKVYTNFCSKAKHGVLINHKDTFTEMYLLDFSDLKSELSDYDLIKVVMVEDGKDVFDFSNHKRLDFKIGENHMVTIEEMSEDVLFVE